MTDRSASKQNSLSPVTTNCDSDLTSNNAVSDVNKAQAPQQWQRIAPIALVYFAVRVIYYLASNFIYIVPMLVFFYQRVIDNPNIWLPIAVIFLFVVFTVPLLKFLFFQYRLSGQHIEVKSGVLSRKYINLPFSRIQNIKLKQPFYYRPFNYTCLQLDTAGSNRQETEISALKLSAAEQLKSAILASRQRSTDQVSKNSSVDNDQVDGHKCSIEANTDHVADAVNEQILNRRSMGDLVLHGFTNNRIWVFIAGLLPFSEKIQAMLKDSLSSFDINFASQALVDHSTWWQISLYVLLILALLIGIFSLISIAISITNFYDFTLSKIADRYIRNSGLLTKHQVSMRLSRLQMVIKKQGWLDLLFNRSNLTFEQLSSSVQAGGEQHNKIVVPSITPQQCQHLVADVYPNNQLMTITYQAVSKQFLLRYIVYMLCPLAFIACSYLLLIDKHQAFYLVVAVFCLLSSMIYFRWKRWGIAVDSNYIYLRKGMFGVNYYCFPRYKVQQISFVQSWFLKRQHLASVNFILACGKQSIAFIDEQMAYNLLDSTLYEVESTKKSWM